MRELDEQATADRPASVDVVLVPGEGTTLFLRGTLDVRHVAELEEKLRTAHTTHPPVTVDLTETVSLDSAIVNVLADLSAGFPEGMRVQGVLGTSARSLDVGHLEHLLVS